MGLPDWGTAVGAVFGKVMTYIPGRIEKLKNEKAKLEKEKFNLLQGDCDVKKSNRLVDIDNRINAINILLTNKATD